MGWVKGFGFKLLVDMIRFFPVSHVVQLSHSGVNQCPALTPDFLRTANGFQTHPPAQTALDEFTESHSPPRIYSHISIQAEFQGVGSQGTAKHQRSSCSRHSTQRFGYDSSRQLR
ncbi:polynucleotide 5'-hydroxyl-kinase NOL9-like [Neolamprologus brichardi]|uniref:polynucleotide 5'-hydroxyl-kinase NOL9-like n=1 Tax=Neolamprologus brichardi TaxID=32507 RepID=UPI0003EC5A26|nr:polynucleotide 5'-hydroxyl-kinase NOL9-like [Neolamprologus brichardi]